MRAIFNIGLLLLTTYLGLNAVMPEEGGGNRQVVQLVAGLGILVMFTYCSFHGLKSIRITKDWRFTKYWMFFISLMAFYYLMGLLDFPSGLARKNPRSLLVTCYIILTAFFIYYGVLTRHLTSAKITALTGILFLAGMMDLFDAVSNPRNKLGVDVINTSSGYVFAMLLPLLMHRYKDQAIWVFIFTLALTAITGKRGALVIYAALFLYSVINVRTLTEVVKINYKAMLAIILVVVASFYFFDVAYQSLLHRVDTIVNPKTGTVGSGRDILWTTFLSHWWDSGFAGMMLGSGYYSTLSINGFVAHSDFVQFLTDYGILGLGIYGLFLAKFYKNIRTIRRVDAYLYYLLMICFVVLVGRGAFAGTIRTDQIYWSVSLGYLLGVATKMRWQYGAAD